MWYFTACCWLSNEHCFQAKKFINVDDRSDGFSVLKNLIASHSWQNIVRIMRNFKLLDEPVIRRIMTWLSSATNQQIKLETLYELSKSNVISSRDAKGFLEGNCCNWFIVYIYLLSCFQSTSNSRKIYIGSMTSQSFYWYNL